MRFLRADVVLEYANEVAAAHFVITSYSIHYTKLYETGIPTSVRPLTLDDARALSRLPHITGMTAVVWGNTEIKGNGRLRRSIVYGQSADMPG